MYSRSLLTLSLALVLGSLGCKGDPGEPGLNGTNGTDGADGANGTDGTNGTDGMDGLDGQDGQDGQDGEDGTDVSAAPAGSHGLYLTLNSVESTLSGKTYDVVLTFTITKDGVPYIDADGVPGSTNGLPYLDQATFYSVGYDAATQTFDNSFSFDRKTVAAVDGMPGQYTITKTGAMYAPESSNAEVYAYVADDALETEQPDGSHVALYDYVSSAALAFGTAATDPYESPVNVEGCESCHGSPYMKHGYRVAQVDGLPDFAACKTCHYDSRSGGHIDWQMLADDPLRYSEIFYGDSPTTEESTYYAYTANLMNDVHMSHAMEFPYPQSMSNCVTCHEGKFDEVFADENFTIETCRSCHPVTGSDDYGTSEHSLTTIWENAGVSSYHSIEASCSTCHVTGGAASGVTLRTLHNGGYDPMIFAADGTRYSDAIIVTIDDADFNSSTNVLTADVTVTEAIDVPGISAADVTPDVRAALYTYDSKDFFGYVSSSVTDDDAGHWVATIDLSSYASYIAEDGKLRRVEIVVRPTATVVDGSESQSVAPIAPSRTFDLTANDFSDGYYPEVVDVEKCNACHDTLATTFHSPNRSGNIVVCRMCHNPTSAGSHLEMQSRSIDSYIHAIHSFQPFDPGDINFDDPVEAMEYELHIEHRFPNFTIKNCEACHNEGMYEVPDQTMTTAAVLSGSDTVDGRDINGIDSTIVGPGARSCGACHRAHYINEDDFNGLVSFNRHTQLNGYSVAYSSGVWDTVVDTVLSYFGEDTAATVDVGPETCAVCHEGQGAEHQLIYDDYIDPT